MRVILLIALIALSVMAVSAFEQEGQDMQEVESYVESLVEVEAEAQCAWRCQAPTLPCGGAYVRNLCGSGSNVCCPKAPTTTTTPTTATTPAVDPIANTQVVPHTNEGTRGALNLPTDLLAPTRQAAVDASSERRIGTLHRRFQPYARAFINECKAAGLDVRIVQGLRTYAEQDALYAQGRTTRGNIVTRARGGQSNHNFGTAIDVGIFINNRYIDSDPAYRRSMDQRYGAVAIIGKRLGLEWGGDWTSMVDMPHFQLRPTWAVRMSESQMMTELRRRKAANIDYYQ